jgi:hypothetical protein
VSGPACMTGGSGDDVVQTHHQGYYARKPKPENADHRGYYAREPVISPKMTHHLDGVQPLEAHFKPQILESKAVVSLVRGGRDKCTFLKHSTASERRGNNFKGFKDFNLRAKARFWPWLSYLCRFCSAAEIGNPSGLGMEQGLTIHLKSLRPRRETVN